MTAVLTVTDTPSGVRGVLLVVEHLWTWYRRNWRATVISSVAQPLLMLLAFGMGLGSLVRPSPATGNVAYLVYLAPGLLAMAAVQIAAGESSYPVLSGFKWSRIYHAMTASPLTAAQLVGGQLTWIGLRLLASGAAYLAVIALFGGTRGVGALGALLFATLCGLAVSAPIVAYAASVQNEGTTFSALFRFVILPMTLFAGTFFPVSQLPAWVRPLAWVSPLWHGTELARGAALGTLRPLPAVGHTGYLLAMLAIGAVLAVWRFRVRLYP
ncbi:MAG TPA: ABC transporter permease [Pseudonocardiaceae bacterium]